MYTSHIDVYMAYNGYANGNADAVQISCRLQCMFLATCLQSADPVQWLVPVASTLTSDTRIKCKPRRVTTAFPRWCRCCFTAMLSASRLLFSNCRSSATPLACSARGIRRLVALPSRAMASTPAKRAKGDGMDIRFDGQRIVVTGAGKGACPWPVTCPVACPVACRAVLPTPAAPAAWLLPSSSRLAPPRPPPLPLASPSYERLHLLHPLRHSFLLLSTPSAIHSLRSPLRPPLSLCYPPSFATPFLCYPPSFATLPPLRHPLSPPLPSLPPPFRHPPTYATHLLSFFSHPR